MITDYAANLLIQRANDLEDQVRKLERKLEEQALAYESKLEKQRLFFVGQIQQERQEKRTIIDRFIPEIQNPEYKNYEARNANGSGEKSQDEFVQHRFKTPTDYIKKQMEAENIMWEEKRKDLEEGARRVVEKQRERDAQAKQEVV